MFASTDTIAQEFNPGLPGLPELQPKGPTCAPPLPPPVLPCVPQFVPTEIVGVVLVAVTIVVAP
jgi:hypothetical protein